MKLSKLTRALFRAARLSATAGAVTSGDPKRMARRAKNIVVGRALSRLGCRGEGYEPPEIVRLALNMEQVEEMQPPPNPAKLTDSRAEQYIARFGDESWELDAIEPTTLAELVRDNLEPLIERDAWNASEEAEEKGREQLRRIANDWKYVNDMLRKPHTQRDFEGNWS